MDTTTEGFLHDDDPILIAYNDFRARFGRDDAIIIGIETPDLFTHAFLERLSAFHEELETSVPHLDEITSMINARWTRGEADQLLVEDLVEEMPRTAEDLVELKERVYSNPLYINTLVTPDGRLSTVEVELDTFVQEGIGEDGRPILRYLDGPEHRDIIDAVYDVMARHEGPEFRLFVAGMPLLADRVAFRIIDDAPRLVGPLLAVISLVLYLLFSRVRAVLIPLVVVIMATTGTLGLMPLLDIPYQMPTQIVPVSLLAIGVGDSVHILAIYCQRRRRGDAKIDAMTGAFEHAGTAVLMTSLTTAAAMASFLTGELAPVANVGILLPLGVMLAFLFTVTVLPAALIILPEKKDPAAQRRIELLERISVGTGEWSASRPWTVLGIAGVILLIAFAGIAALGFAHDPVRWFPASDPFRVSTEHLNDRLGGVVTIEFLYETPGSNGVQEPGFLRQLEKAAALNADHRGPRHARGAAELSIVKTISLVDVLKEINRALNENRQDHYVLPDTRELTAQELLLFELSGSDDLEDLTDYEYETARMTMRVPWLDATQFGGFIETLVPKHQALVGPDVNIIATGRVPLLTRTVTAVIYSMARAYVLALIAVTPLMIVLLGRWKLGLLAMVPNVFPVIMALGLMGWMGLSLDAFSLLVGSIIIGLAVDDTIHFMNGYSLEYERTGDPILAVRETLATTGQALFFTTLILCCAYSTYLLAYMRNLSSFGVVTAFALFVAFLADIALTPALVVLMSKRQRAPDA